MTVFPFPALPAVGPIVADEPAWPYPSSIAAGGGLAHLRVWQTSVITGGHLAIVTQTDVGASVTNSIEQIWTALVARYRRPLWLIEHYPRDEEFGDSEHLDQVLVTLGHPRWRRIWPTPPSNADHVEFEAWMSGHGHRLLRDGFPLGR